MTKAEILRKQDRFLTTEMESTYRSILEGFRTSNVKDPSRYFDNVLEYPSGESIKELLEFNDLRSLASKVLNFELSLDDKLKYREVQRSHVKLLKEL